MSTWIWLLAACAIAFTTKFVGYLLPDAWLENPRVVHVSNAVTIGLLGSLVLLNTLATGQHLVLDARVVALAAAIIALLLRAPFIVVVIVGAAAAALVRLAGWHAGIQLW